MDPAARPRAEPRAERRRDRRRRCILIASASTSSSTGPSGSTLPDDPLEHASGRSCSIVLGGLIVLRALGRLADAMATSHRDAADPAGVERDPDPRRLASDDRRALRRGPRGSPRRIRRGALAVWRSTRERLYREHAQSPVPAAARATFRAHHFDHDPALRFEVVVEGLEAEPGAAGARRPGRGSPSAGSARSASPASSIDLPVSAGGAMAFRRFGAVTIPFPSGPRRLELYWMEGYAGGLFLPFRDATNGPRDVRRRAATCSTRRRAPTSARDAAPNSLVLDFNFAFQPSCAFDPKWACPLAPPSNRLDLEVRAGRAPRLTGADRGRRERPDVRPAAADLGPSSGRSAVRRATRTMARSRPARAPARAGTHDTGVRIWCDSCWAREARTTTTSGCSGRATSGSLTACAAYLPATARYELDAGIVVIGPADDLTDALAAEVAAASRSPPTAS